MRQSHFGVTLIQIVRRRGPSPITARKKPTFVEVGAEAELYEYSVLVTSLDGVVAESVAKARRRYRVCEYQGHRGFMATARAMSGRRAATAIAIPIFPRL
jgi:hypothetical protein